MTELTTDDLRALARKWQRGDYVKFNERLAVVKAATAGILLAEIATNPPPGTEGAVETLKTIQNTANNKAKDLMP